MIGAIIEIDKEGRIVNVRVLADCDSEEQTVNRVLRNMGVADRLPIVRPMLEKTEKEYGLRYLYPGEGE